MAAGFGKLVDPYWDHVAGNLDTEADYLVAIGEVPRPAVFLVATQLCQSEICNGGFLQLFHNSSGMLVPEAVEGFHALGMPLTAGIVQDAAMRLGDQYPRERKMRQGVLLAASEASPEELNRLAAEKGFWTALMKASERLGLEQLKREFYKVIGNENGGFDDAANRFAEQQLQEPK